MPRVNRTYIYNNQTFTSIKALSQYTGVHEKTITARLRKGMSVEEACNPKKLSGKYYLENGEEKLLTQICREQAKDINLVRNRLKYGYTLNQALNKPKKIARQGVPVVVNGVLYNSLSEAMRKLNLSHKEGTIRSRLRLGWSVDEAFCFDKKN